MENSERDGNTRPPDLPPEKSVCRSRSKLEPDMEQSTGGLGEDFTERVLLEQKQLIARFSEE